MNRIDFARDKAVCVITGAASGIGAAIALEVARRGGNLALVDVNEESLKAIAFMVAAQGAQVSIHPCDVTNESRVMQLPKQVLRMHREAQVLINAAGVSLFGSFGEFTLEEFKWLLDVNFWGTVAVTKAFLPSLQLQSAAHIANLSSAYGVIPPAASTPYLTSKFAVRGFTEALRQELAGSSVRVCAVHSGAIKTEITMKTQAANAASEDIEQKAVYRTTPEETARAIVDAVEHGRSRLLITRDSRMMAWLDGLVSIGY